MARKRGAPGAPITKMMEDLPPGGIGALHLPPRQYLQVPFSLIVSPPSFLRLPGSKPTAIECSLSSVLRRAVGKLQGRRLPPPLPKGRTPDSRAVPDQVSLHDCPILIQPNALWGSEAGTALDLPALPSLVPVSLADPLETAVAPPPAELGPPTQQVVLSPAQIQQMITAVVHQSLVSQRLSASAPASVRSDIPTHQAATAQEDALSIAASASPLLPSTAVPLPGLATILGTWTYQKMRAFNRTSWHLPPSLNFCFTRPLLLLSWTLLPNLPPP